MSVIKLQQAPETFTALELFGELYENVAEFLEDVPIDGMALLWVEGDGTVNFEVTKKLKNDQALFALEHFKQEIMKD